MPSRRILQDHIIIFALPFLSELKISWAFAAAPLHFQARVWPLWAFGATIGGATLGRIPMNFAITAVGDWAIGPILLLFTACAVVVVGWMLS